MARLVAICCSFLVAFARAATGNLRGNGSNGSIWDETNNGDNASIWAEAKRGKNGSIGASAGNIDAQWYSPPTPVSDYDVYRVNCYDGHGANQLDNQPVVVHSAQDCAYRCTVSGACDCVVFERGWNRCWRRSYCDRAQCANGGRQYVTYFKAWSRAPARTPAWQPSPPTPVSDYNVYRVNCYDGHGAYQLDNQPVVVHSAQDCAYRCTITGACNCVVFESGWNKCWMRSNCNRAHCANGGAQYVTYFKAWRPPAPTAPQVHGYNMAPVNCYNGHGASQIDNSPVAVQSAQACAGRCGWTRACSCVVYQARGGNCWTRSNCVESQCEGGGGNYVTYFKNSWHMPAPTPARQIHGYNMAPVNCYNGNGAQQIDNHPLTVQSAQACVARCEWTGACDCVVYQEHGRNCWTRENCNRARCAAGAGQFVTYFKVAPSGPRAPESGGTCVEEHVARRRRVATMCSCRRRTGVSSTGAYECDDRTGTLLFY